MEKLPKLSLFSLKEPTLYSNREFLQSKLGINVYSKYPYRLAIFAVMVLLNDRKDFINTQISKQNREFLDSNIFNLETGGIQSIYKDPFINLDKIYFMTVMNSFLGLLREDIMRYTYGHIYREVVKAYTLMQDKIVLTSNTPNILFHSVKINLLSKLINFIEPALDLSKELGIFEEMSSGLFSLVDVNIATPYKIEFDLLQPYDEKDPLTMTKLHPYIMTIFIMLSYPFIIPSKQLVDALNTISGWDQFLFSDSYTLD